MAAISALTGSLPIGVSSFGPITPSVGVTSIQVAIDRTLGIALLSKTIAWKLELSSDAGNTWIQWGGATTPSGPLMSSTGITGVEVPVPVTESSITVNIPPADVNTRLRGSVTTQEAVTTSVTVRMS